MREFGPRNSTYAVNLRYNRHTDTYISRKNSIEQTSVGLALLAQLCDTIEDGDAKNET